MNLGKKTQAAGAVCVVSVITGIVLSHGSVRSGPTGLALIGQAESCRRDPYVCPAGHITDGIGNTQNIHPGETKTDEQIAADWERNILQAEACVNRYAGGVKLPQGAFEAATSLSFNVGCGAIQQSTIFKLFHSGNIPAACEQFPRWVYAGGKVLPGLVKRRQAERERCLLK